MWRWRRDLNPSHIGGKLPLSPPRHPLLPSGWPITTTFPNSMVTPLSLLPMQQISTTPLYLLSLLLTKALNTSHTNTATSFFLVFIIWVRSVLQRGRLFTIYCKSNRLLVQTNYFLRETNAIWTLFVRHAAGVFVRLKGNISDFRFTCSKGQKCLLTIIALLSSFALASNSTLSAFNSSLLLRSLFFSSSFAKKGKKKVLKVNKRNKIK